MLFIGVDLGKKGHYAAFVSAHLIEAHKRAVGCPTLKFDNSAEGFELLLSTIRQYADGGAAAILLERTGHYGLALEEFLHKQEEGLQLYRIISMKKLGRDKTDKKDALALAAILYNQVHLKVQITDPKMRVYRLASNPTAAFLRVLVVRRYELVRQGTRLKNQLTGLCDQLVPELTHTYKDPNSASALALREQFPTAQLIADASIDDLCKTRKHRMPSRDNLLHLQEIARTSVGIKDAQRQRALILEQSQLITALRLTLAQLATLDQEITEVITPLREGQILASFTGVGPIQAAALFSGIGCIANFENAGKLKAYFGWAPRRMQTGTTMDKTALVRVGHPMMRHTMYLVTISSLIYDKTWRALYDRLVARGEYDPIRQTFRGKKKVMGRITGQIIKVMYVLLKRDYDLLQSLKEGETPPPPELYDTAKHRVVPAKLVEDESEDSGIG
jgi:transposase